MLQCRKNAACKLFADAAYLMYVLVNQTKHIEQEE